MDIKQRLNEYKRVLQVARKPGKDEFKSTTKISITSLGIIGVIGFAVYLAFVLTGI